MHKTECILQATTTTKSPPIDDEGSKHDMNE